MVGWLLAKRNKKGINLEELLAGLLTVGLVVTMMVMMSMTTILENDYDCQDRVKEPPRLLVVDFGCETYT